MHGRGLPASRGSNAGRRHGASATAARVRRESLRSVLAGERLEDCFDRNELVLRIERWIADPKSSDGSEIDGVATTRITGTLRVATALRDLLALGRRAGTDVGAEPIGEATSEKLEDAKEGASITLHTGEDDRILRRLALRARFPLERTRDLGGTIGRLRGAEVRFSLSLRRVGRAVRVKRPANPQPYSSLSGGA